jgi:hypothetical protein
MRPQPRQLGYHGRPPPRPAGAPTACRWSPRGPSPGLQRRWRSPNPGRAVRCGLWTSAGQSKSFHQRCHTSHRLNAPIWGGCWKARNNALMQSAAPMNVGSHL